MEIQIGVSVTSGLSEPITQVSNAGISPDQTEDSETYESYSGRVRDRGIMHRPTSQQL